MTSTPHSEREFLEGLRYEDKFPDADRVVSELTTRIRELEEQNERLTREVNEHAAAVQHASDLQDDAETCRDQWIIMHGRLKEQYEAQKTKTFEVAMERRAAWDEVGVLKEQLETTQTELDAIRGSHLHEWIARAQRAEEQVQSLQAERDHYRFHFDEEQKRAERAEEQFDAAMDCMNYAWTIICNVNEGDWAMQPPKWQEAAARCRDQYHALLAANPAAVPSEEPDPASLPASGHSPETGRGTEMAAVRPPATSPAGCPVCEGIDQPGLLHNPEAPYCSESAPASGAKEKLAQDPEQEKVQFEGPDRYCPICGTARGFHHVSGADCAPASRQDS